MEGQKRIGLLVPSSNTVMEVDFYRHLPPGVTLHTGRMYLESTTPEGEGVMLDRHAIPAARDLATAKPEVIVFGCTSAGALRGNAYDADLCRKLARVTGRPVVSTIASVRDAVQSAGARRVGIVTPYVNGLNERIRMSLEEDGLEVVSLHGMGITDNFAIALVRPEAIVDFARQHLPRTGMDLLFVSCTNYRAMEAIGELERIFGVPVVTSNQAVLKAALRAVAATSG